MLQASERFASVDKKIAEIAEKKLRLHLWYLSEDLAALPLFSDDVSDDDKGVLCRKNHSRKTFAGLLQIRFHNFRTFLLHSLSHGVHSICLSHFDCRKSSCLQQ